MGFSRGGGYVYEFTRKRGTRVIGFMTQKGNCHAVGDGELARLVPGYFFIGGADEASRADNINQVFQDNRPNGALWSIAVEKGAVHTPVSRIDLFGEWMDAVLELRLPANVTPGNPVTLNTLSDASGWLGNRQSFVIADYGNYDGDKSEASWLPSMQAAEEWNVLVSLTSSL